MALRFFLDYSVVFRAIGLDQSTRKTANGHQQDLIKTQKVTRPSGVPA